MLRQNFIIFFIFILFSNGLWSLDSACGQKLSKKHYRKSQILIQDKELDNILKNLLRIIKKYYPSSVILSKKIQEYLLNPYDVKHKEPKKNKLKKQQHQILYVKTKLKHDLECLFEFEQIDTVNIIYLLDRNNKLLFGSKRKNKFKISENLNINLEAIRIKKLTNIIGELDSLNLELSLSLEK